MKFLVYSNFRPDKKGLNLDNLWASSRKKSSIDYSFTNILKYFINIKVNE
jgi:hypothetical protein